MRKKDKRQQNIFIGLLIVVALVVSVIFALGFNGGSLVKFRTSDPTYNYIIDPQSSIAYTEKQGSQLYAYGVAGYAPKVCEGSYEFLFDIPGDLNNKPVKLYKDTVNTNWLYVCNDNEAIRYSKESWFTEGSTVSLDSNSVNPELEVNF